MKNFLFYLFFLAVNLNFGQNNQVAWEYTVSGSNHGLIVDSLGNSYIMNSNIIQKRSGSGNLLWTDTMATICTGIKFDNRGNIVTFGSLGADIYLHKISPQKNFLWETIIDDQNLTNTPVAIDFDIQNNLLALGNNSITNTRKEVLLCKIDTAGNLVWKKNYSRGLQFTNAAQAICSDENLNYYVSCTNENGIYTDFDSVLVLKYSAAGDLKKIQGYQSYSFQMGQVGITIAYSNLFYNSGFLFLFYSGVITQQGACPAYISYGEKIDTTLNQKTTFYCGDAEINVQYNKKTHDFLGYSNKYTLYLNNCSSIASINANYFSFSDNGAPLTSKTYSDYNFNFGSNYYHLDSDRYLIIYNQSNIQRSLKLVDGGFNLLQDLDYSYNTNLGHEIISNDLSSAVYVHLFTWNYSILRKYNQNVSVRELSGNYTNFEIFPNPAIDLFYIDFKEPSMVLIFDLRGKEIYRKKLETKNSQIDVSTFSEGIYFVKVSGENFCTTKKLIIQR